MKIIGMFIIVTIAVLIAGGALFAFGPGSLPEEDRPAGGVSDMPRITLSVPVMSPRFEKVLIAEVNGEGITLGDLSNALISSHEGRKESEKQGARIDYSEILNRLINVRLIVQEAREMGLDELPEVKKTVREKIRPTVRELLIEDLSKDVKVDETEVERFRREMVKEWKIKSVLFEKEEDARKMEEEVKAGKDFDELAAKAIADKTAKGQGEGGFVKSKELLPDVAAVVSRMEVGALSPVIEVGSDKNRGFALIKLEEIRFPEDPQTRERARAAVLSVARTEAIKDFKKEAYKSNVKVNKKLLDGLDFEAKKADFEKFLKDKRVVATVKGERPVTVKDLSEALKGKFFHGIERGVRDKEVNKKKYEVLDELLEKRLFEKEAEKRGIEKSERFREKMKEYEESLLFGLFAQKVLVPDVKVSEEDMKSYYDEHIRDFTYPEMMRLDSLVFEKLADAESALARLKQGADFKWLKTNAEGQVDKGVPNLLFFEGKTVVTRDLPERVQKALTGAQSETYRLYQSPEDHFYILYVQSVTPSSQQPFEEAKGTIAKQVFNRKLNAAVQEWADKLRESADVKVYLSAASEAGKEAGKQ